MKSARSIYREIKQLLASPYASRLTNPSNWKGLTKQQKRKAILVDVMKQVMIGKYVPTTQYDDCELTDAEPQKKSVQALLLTYALPCHICQRGAMLLSCIRFNNKITVGQFNNNGIWGKEEKAGIDDLFPENERPSMESAFEDYKNFSAYKKLPGIPKNIARNRNFLMMAIAYNAYCFDTFSPKEWNKR